jgi:hypothetical protein
VSGRFERPAEGLNPLDHLRVRPVARGPPSGDVPLDVRDEDRDTSLRQLAREELEGLRLAVPVAPAIRPWRFIIESATWIRASLSSSPASIGLPMVRPGSPSA